ncbi:MAG TPA: hypothetical protein VFM93_09115 [Candidatus Limnocylindria bacterium]|nr:hypothetical protein [Candidatus Limnocylindria bacterium]
MSRLAASDRDAAVEILQHASYLQALTLTATRAQVVRSDQARADLVDRYRRIGAAAGRLSKAARDRLDAPWDALERAVRTAKRADPEDQVKELWTGIRRVVRPLAAALRDEVGEDPSAAFALDPEVRRAEPGGKKARRR